MTPLTKRCSHCGETLPISKFVHNRSTKDGYDYWCSYCRSHKKREYRDRRPGRERDPEIAAALERDAARNDSRDRFEQWRGWGAFGADQDVLMLMGEQATWERMEALKAQSGATTPG